MTEPSRRRPVVFRLDDPSVVVSDPSAPTRPQAARPSPPSPQPSEAALEQVQTVTSVAAKASTPSAGQTDDTLVSQSTETPLAADVTSTRTSAKTPQETPTTRIDVEARPLAAARPRAQTSAPPAETKSKNRFTTLIWSAIGGLISLYISLQIWMLIEELAHEPGGYSAGLGRAWLRRLP